MCVSVSVSVSPAAKGIQHTHESHKKMMQNEPHPTPSFFFLVSDDFFGGSNKHFFTTAAGAAAGAAAAAAVMESDNAKIPPSSCYMCEEEEEEEEPPIATGERLRTHHKSPKWKGGGDGDILRATSPSFLLSSIC